MSNAILILFLGILILPIFSIIGLSIQNNNGDIFKWYKSIIGNEEFTNAFLLSAFVSVLTTIISVSFSFLLSLSWFHRRQSFVVLLMILISGLLPADIFALGIIKASQFLGIYSSNIFLLIVGLVFYSLPFNILLIWARFYFIEKVTLDSAKDVGLERFYIITKIILPLSKSTLVTCLILCFLLSFNEYSRTYYLSGSEVLLSEFLNGKLNSGADESIYAGGSITILMTAILFVGGFIMQIILHNRRNKTIYSNI